MAQIEKSVFISYRRTNIYHARATFQDLRAKGYDVFMDYETMNAGDFEQIILNQIKARAHFVVILTPSALERCAEPNDWLRREIETAIDYKRNIIPLMFDGFDWNSVQPYLTGKLAILSNYNALKIPAEYFDEAMNRLHIRFLNVAIEAVLHPTPKDDEKIIAQKLLNVVNQPPVTEAQLTSNIYLETGNLHYHMGEYDKAIADYIHAIELNPKSSEAYINRGVVYYDTGEYSLAIADYTHAIELNPKSSLAHHNRGLCYASQANYNVAIHDFDSAIKLDPKYFNAYFNRGFSYSARNQYDNAIKDYTMAIKLNPQHIDAYVNRGNCYFRKNEFERAITDYNEALSLNPKYIMAYFNRAMSYTQIEDYNKAINDYDKVIQLNSLNTDALLNRGNIYLMMNEYDKAIADYDYALEIDSNLASAHNNRARAVQKKQELSIN